MIRKNDIVLKDLLSWLDEETIEYASSPRERKRLFVNFKGDLIITIAGETVWQGKEPSLAIAAYNRITHKYVDSKPVFIL